MRKFGQLGTDLHIRLSIPVTHFQDAMSCIFPGEARQICYAVWERQGSGEKTYSTATEDTLSSHNLGELPVRMVHTGPFRRVLGYLPPGSAISRLHIQSVFIPDTLEEIGSKTFSQFKAISRVTFGGSPSLRRIGCAAFRWCYALTEIAIPDTVEEICDECFSACENLRRVTFGESSSLKRIGTRAFLNCGLVEIRIPGTVEEICGMSFCQCRRLARVTFDEMASLKRLGPHAFSETGLRRVVLPNSVEEIGDECFGHCQRLSHVGFGDAPSLKHIGLNICINFFQTVRMQIPDLVE